MHPSWRWDDLQTPALPKDAIVSAREQKIDTIFAGDPHTIASHAEMLYCRPAYRLELDVIQQVILVYLLRVQVFGALGCGLEA